MAIGQKTRTSRRYPIVDPDKPKLRRGSASYKGYKEADYAKALEANAGIQFLAAKALGVTRQAVRDWIMRSPRLQELVDECNEKVSDIGEGHVKKAIQKGEDMITIRWWLERKAKHRGYVTRTENTGRGGGPIQTVDLSRLSVKELEAMEAMLLKAESEI